MRYNNRMREHHCTNLPPDIEPEVSPDSTPDSCHSQQLNDNQPPLTDIHPFFQKKTIYLCNTTIKPIHQT